MALLHDRFPINFSVAAVFVFPTGEAGTRFIAPYLESGRHCTGIILYFNVLIGRLAETIGNSGTDATFSHII